MNRNTYDHTASESGVVEYALGDAVGGSRARSLAEDYIGVPDRRARSEKLGLRGGQGRQWGELSP